MKILLINQGYSDNLGDKAIKYMLMVMLKKLDHQVEFCGFTQFVEQSLEFSNKKDVSGNKILLKLKKSLPVSLKWKVRKERDIKKILSKMDNNFDFIIIGGGQLVKSNCYFPYAMQFWTDYASKINSKIVLFGIGCDQNLSTHEKKTYIKAFKKCENITVRDKASQNFLKKEFEIECSYVPDVAFSLYNYVVQNKNSKKKDVVVMIYSYTTYKSHFRHKINIKEYYDRWIEIINQHVDRDTFIKLAYSTYEDKIETYNFINYLKMHIDNKVKILNSDTLTSLLNILGESEKVITGRMHPMIFGVLANCKVIPFSISDKIDTFKQEWLLNENEINFNHINKTIFKKLNEVLD